MIKPIITIFLLISSALFCQQIKIEGFISNKSNGTPLSFATLRILGTMNGATSNSEGKYQLKINKGNYRIAVSYIGYINDTISVVAEKNISGLDIGLVPVSIDLPEVTILPGKNPALEIIRKAIEKRKQREELIKSFEYTAYTKGIVRSDQEMSANGNAVSIGVGESKDSAELQINGILENESKGYFLKPGKYKEYIVAQKQSANFPSSVNFLTGGRIIQNFYNDDIMFFNRPIPGPISDDALDYYYYYITDTLKLDNEPVFKIFFAPDNDSDPGFTGTIVIKDSTFDMVEVDANLNRAANIGGLFEKVRIFQQFLSYNNIYMPIDYRLFLKANILGIARVGFEVNSVMHDYRINETVNPDIFDKAVITIVPGADSKDSTYWANAYAIPGTEEELQAYKKIDSLQSIPRSFWKDFPENLLASDLSLNDSISITAPLGIYHFNRIEGHSLDFDLKLREFYNKRLNTGIEFHYGFSDKKIKSEWRGNYYFGEYRTLNLSGRIFNNLEILYNESDSYNDFTATVLSLFSKYEFRNYYYSKGFNINFSGDVFPVLNMGIGFLNRTDNSAYVNTDYSFFAKKKSYRDNPPIFETKINAISLSFGFDFRNYIEDGYFRRRLSEGKSHILFGGEILHSSSRLLKSKMDFTKFNFNISGTLNTFRSAKFNYRIFTSISDGALPYQMFYALPGNLDGVSKEHSFRTVRIGEYAGDRIVTFNLEHNFNDELFKIFRIPGLKNSDLLLTTYINAGWIDVSKKSKAIIPVEYTTLRNPLLEAGFSIGHMLFPLRFEFTWRLNHREKTKFEFGINAFVF